MDIFYSKTGVPVLIVDGIVYDFNYPDRGELLAQLALSPDSINEIKQKIVEYLLTLRPEEFLNQPDSYSNLKSWIRILGQSQALLFVLDTLESAEDTSIMISTPQPYLSWYWDGADKKWNAPIPYPQNVPVDAYVWSEDRLDWVPAENSPFPSWEWNKASTQWEPPVSYPLDAEPNQFKWSEQDQNWVLNV